MIKLLTLKDTVLVCSGIVFADDPAALYRSTIPEDKNLDPAWVESLTQCGHKLDRGIKGSKSDDTLKYIGMPVGRIACGTVSYKDSGSLSQPVNASAGEH